jgi:hypothetical protein
MCIWHPRPFQHSKARLHHYSSIRYVETWYHRKVSGGGAVTRVGKARDKWAECLLILTVLCTKQFIFIYVTMYRKSVKPATVILCKSRIYLNLALVLWNSLSKSYLSLRLEVILLSGVLVQGVQLKAEALVYSTNPPTDFLHGVFIAVECVTLL